MTMCRCYSKISVNLHKQSSLHACKVTHILCKIAAKMHCANVKQKTMQRPWLTSFEGLVRNVWANWLNVKHWFSTLKHFLQILQNIEFTDAKFKYCDAQKPLVQTSLCHERYNQMKTRFESVFIDIGCRKEERTLP
jgi:hypothetical protein